MFFFILFFIFIFTYIFLNVELIMLWFWQLLFWILICFDFAASCKQLRHQMDRPHDPFRPIRLLYFKLAIHWIKLKKWLIDVTNKFSTSAMKALVIVDTRCFYLVSVSEPVQAQTSAGLESKEKGNNVYQFIAIWRKPW